MGLSRGWGFRALWGVRLVRPGGLAGVFGVVWLGAWGAYDRVRRCLWFVGPGPAVGRDRAAGEARWRCRGRRWLG